MDQARMFIVFLVVVCMVFTLATLQYISKDWYPEELEEEERGGLIASGGGPAAVLPALDAATGNSFKVTRIPASSFEVSPPRDTSGKNDVGSWLKALREVAEAERKAAALQAKGKGSGNGQ
jgi:hypothetical protein